MNRQLFIETIKVKDGIFCNLPLHLLRLKKTANYFFGVVPQLNLSLHIIPEELREGLVKCRVVYNQTIVSIEFEPYVFKKINRLAVIHTDEIEYPYKSADRKDLNNLLSKKGYADDIIIVKNGLLTDTSYANIVLEKNGSFYTPQSFLLPGTKRQLLLEKGIVSQCEISVSDLSEYSAIYLINAMIDLEDEVCIPLSRLVM